ncbi:efflux RND transporter periplasmic adaptor subunit [Chondromyces apiculatus]|uniref:efflux RND transporter periplasmic adaptor subunit n=1 Tax=Chondromyces apiculatus TaxID=51 RepID=UPI0018CC038A|nr:efflux RND transporter periplasmic adaptor subunit [Chondromyces apiculatus]
MRRREVREARWASWGGSLAALMVALAGSGCGKGTEATAAAESKVQAQPPAQGVEGGSGRGSAPTPWVKARAAGDTALLEAPAVVLAPPEAAGAVAAPFAARVTRIHVQPGQAVEKGAPVVDVLMPELIGASGAYAAAGTRLAAHRRRKAQLDGLRADGLVKLSEMAEVEAQIADAEADQQIAAATLRSAGMGPGEAGRVLGSGGGVTLRSPVAGVVTEVRAALGEMRDPAGEPLARVVGGGAARVEARLPSRPPEGARYDLVIGAAAPTLLRKVAEAPAVDGRDGTLRIWLEAEGTFSAPHGALGKVRVRVDPGSGAVVVPTAALAMQGGGAVVVARKTGQPLQVEVLATAGADALVRGALAAGDEVAAEAMRAMVEVQGGGEGAP